MHKKTNDEIIEEFTNNISHDLISMGQIVFLLMTSFEDTKKNFQIRLKFLKKIHEHHKVRHPEEYDLNILIEMFIENLEASLL
jgi:uncharacterized protein YecE (DUF72 family)